VSSAETVSAQICLQVADRLCRARENVTVIVVGEDRIAYGGRQTIQQVD